MLNLRQGDKTGAALVREMEELALGAGLSLDEPFFLLHFREKQLNPVYLGALINSQGIKLRDIKFAELKQHLLFLDSTQVVALSKAKGTGSKHKEANKGEQSPQRSKYDPTAWCNHCNKHGHTTENHQFPKKKNNQGDDKPSSQQLKKATSTANVTCHSCQEKGHYADKCPKKAAKTDQKTSVTLDLSQIRSKVAKRVAALKVASPPPDPAPEEVEVTEQDIIDSLVELHAERYNQRE
jgi:hypothetical protein